MRVRCRVLLEWLRRSVEFALEEEARGRGRGGGQCIRGKDLNSLRVQTGGRLALDNCSPERRRGEVVSSLSSPVSLRLAVVPPDGDRTKAPELGQLAMRVCLLHYSESLGKCF